MISRIVELIIFFRDKKDIYIYDDDGDENIDEQRERGYFFLSLLQVNKIMNLYFFRGHKVELMEYRSIFFGSRNFDNRCAHSFNTYNCDF